MYSIGIQVNPSSVLRNARYPPMVLPVIQYAPGSVNGIAQSRGVMVNYLYDLRRISRNLQLFAESGHVAASSAIRALAKQAAKARSD